MKSVLMFVFLFGCHSFHPHSKPNAEGMMHGWKFESNQHSKNRRRSKIPRETGDIAKGKLLFQEHCAKCHGISGKGDGPLAKEMDKPSDLTANNWFHKRHFFFMVSEGSVSGMPAWKNFLSDEDIWNLISHIQTL